jgi:hypothetical protein
MSLLDQPSLTFRPLTLASDGASGRLAHLPFACDLIAALRPATLVSVGVGQGDSYFGLCQAVEENRLACFCYGVDEWHENPAGCEAVKRYNDLHYRSFSYLLRNSFRDALQQFSDESIGLLRLDNPSGYEAAREVFETWIRKVRPGGVVLLENISARSGGVEVWRLWEELQSRFQTCSLGSGDGLGVILKKGGEQPTGSYLGELFSSPQQESKEKQERLRKYYALCGERLELENKLKVVALTNAAADEQQRRQTQAVEKSLQQELQIARGNVEELKQEIERLSLSHADIEDELREARRAQARTAAALEQEKSLRAAMERSRSWQLTRRLRGLLDRPES